MAISDKTAFLKAVTVVSDSREKENEHILSALDQMGVAHEARKLDMGDYSFYLPGRDFSLSCAVERKNGPEEIYGNIMEKTGPGRVNRLEKELEAGSRCLSQMTVLIEGVASMDALKAYTVPEWRMKLSPNRVKTDIGETCYAALRAWQAGNRYHFRVECVADKTKTAAKLLEEFYYYYHNYKGLIAPRR